jgi:hypothetical protein
MPATRTAKASSSSRPSPLKHRLYSQLPNISPHIAAQHLKFATVLDRIPKSKKPNANKTIISLQLQDYDTLLESHAELLVLNTELNEQRALSLWESRYTDYIAAVLGRVRWEISKDSIMAAMSWKQIVEIIGRNNEDEQHIHVRNVVRKAAQNLNLTYFTIIEGIKIYSARNNDERHHGGAMELLQGRHFEEWLNKLKEDEKELEAVTPKI